MTLRMPASVPPTSKRLTTCKTRSPLVSDEVAEKSCRVDKTLVAEDIVGMAFTVWFETKKWPRATPRPFCPLWEPADNMGTHGIRHPERQAPPDAGRPFKLWVDRRKIGH